MCFRVATLGRRSACARETRGGGGERERAGRTQDSRHIRYGRRPRSAVRVRESELLARSFVLHATTLSLSYTPSVESVEVLNATTSVLQRCKSVSQPMSAFCPPRTSTNIHWPPSRSSRSTQSPRIHLGDPVLSRDTRAAEIRTLAAASSCLVSNHHVLLPPRPLRAMPNSPPHLTSGYTRLLMGVAPRLPNACVRAVYWPVGRA